MREEPPRWDQCQQEEPRGGDVCLPCEDTASKGPSADQEESLPATEWASARTWTSRTVRVNACR